MRLLSSLLADLKLDKSLGERAGLSDTSFRVYLLLFQIKHFTSSVQVSSFFCSICWNRFINYVLHNTLKK